MSDDRSGCLVLGIGNLLWADEGFGIRCVEAWNERFEDDPRVKLLDGGTQGLYLVPEVTSVDHLLVFDAVDYGRAPGTLLVVRGDEVPKFTGIKKMSLHQTGFQDVLSAADLLGKCPSTLTLIGVQAEQLEDFGGSLTAAVSARVEEAVALGVEELGRWGFPLVARREGSAPLLKHGLDRATYEGGRPSSEQACRSGDSRYFPRSA